MVDDAAGEVSREAAARQVGSGPAELAPHRLPQAAQPFIPQPLFSEDRIAAIHDRAARARGARPESPAAGGAGAVPGGRRQRRRGRRDGPHRSRYRRCGARVRTEVDRRQGREQRPRSHARARVRSASSPAPARPMSATSIAAGARARSPTSRSSRASCRASTCCTCRGPMSSRRTCDNLRHYAVNRAQLALSDKLPFVFARGTPQVRRRLRMIRLSRGLSEGSFRDGVHCYTVINTNSPRQLDIPMAQGIIDFARGRAALDHHAVLPGRRHGAGHRRGRADAAACRGAGRHRAGAARAARRARRSTAASPPTST